MLETLSAALWNLLTVSNVLILVYFLVLNLTYLSLVTISFFYIRRQYKTLGLHDFPHVFESELYKSVSIIVPVYNEGEEVITSVRSFLQLEFNDFEVIMVNDGSTDNTLGHLHEAFNLYESDRYVSDDLPHEKIKKVYASYDHPNLVVVDKENGQKADAMNAGINAARKDLFCAIDGDSWLERDVLIKLMRSFSEDEDTIAVGGIVRISNGCEIRNGEMRSINTPSSFVEAIQVIEYIRAFLLGRTGWEFFDGLLIISGAFGMFDRQAVLKVGGYDPNAIGEDFEMVVKLHRHYKKNNLPHKIAFQPEPVCWTDVPTDWSGLSNQRNRWQRGLFQTLWKFRDMIFNPQYGFVGMVAMPFYFIFELAGAVIEFFGYILIFSLLLTGLLPPVEALLFFIVAVLLGMILSLASLLCDELTYRQYPKFKDIIKLIGVALFESFGYRQLHTWWRVRGMVEYLMGNMGWDKVHRSRKLVNALHWIAFIIIDILLLTLLYYGIVESGLFL